MCSYLMETLVLIKKNERIFEYYLDRLAPFEFDENIAFIKKGALWYLKISNQEYDLRKELKLVFEPSGCFYKIEIQSYHREFKRYLKNAKENLLAYDHKASTIILDQHQLVFIKDGRLIKRRAEVFVNGFKCEEAILNKGDQIRFDDTLIIYQGVLYLIVTSKKVNLADPLILYQKEIKSELKRDYFEDIVFETKKFSLKLEEPPIIHRPSFIFSFLTSFLMAFCMFVIALINLYVSLQSGHNFLQMLSFILMPTVMLMMSLLNPFLEHLRYKSEYKKMLKTYEEVSFEKIKFLKGEIKEYKNAYNLYTKVYLNTCYPDLKYRLSTSPNFLCIPLGFDLDRDLLAYNKDFEHSSANVETALQELSEPLNPLCLLDLKKYRYIRVNTRDCLAWINELILKILAFQKGCDFKSVFIGMEIPSLFKRAPFAYLEHRPLVIADDSAISSLKDSYYYLIFSQKELDLTKINTNMTAFIFNEGGYQELLIDDAGSLLKSGLISRKIAYLRSEDTQNQLQKIIENEGALIKVSRNFELLEYPLEKKEGLLALIGLDVKGNPLFFDISDKGIGPHALVGGSTGSGKSEWLISFILSLCLNYDQDILRVALIDFKGSALSQALSYNGRPLPHIDLSLDNIDLRTFKRYMSIFRLECIKREKAFADLSKALHENIKDLHTYRSAYRKVPGFLNIPYLLLVIDEFAELKKESPDFIKDLISLARIGRSLGILLILATQNPQSVIDDEIATNISYKLALKFKNHFDLRRFIALSDLEPLKKPGEFYLSFDDELIHGQSYYTADDPEAKNTARVRLLHSDLSIAKETAYQNGNFDTRRIHILRKIFSEDKNTIKKALFSLKPKRELLSILKKRYQKGIILGEKDDYQNDQIEACYFNDGHYLIYFRFKEDRQSFIKIILCQSDNNVFYYGKDFDGAKVELLADDDLTYLLNQDLSGLLVIEDLFDLMKKEELYLHFKHRGMNSKLVVIAFVYAGFNDHIPSLPFKNIIDLSKPGKEEMFMRFAKYDELKEDMYILDHGKLLPFFLAKPDLRLKDRAKVLAHLPASFMIKACPPQIFLGYDKSTRQAIKLALESKIGVFAKDHEFLRSFKEQIGITYWDYLPFDEKQLELYDWILFVGKGLCHDLFFRCNYELKEEEAYLYCPSNERGCVIVWKRASI